MLNKELLIDSVKTLQTFCNVFNSYCASDCPFYISKGKQCLFSNCKTPYHWDMDKIKKYSDKSTNMLIDCAEYIRASCDSTYDCIQCPFCSDDAKAECTLSNKKLCEL